MAVRITKCAPDSVKKSLTETLLDIFLGFVMFLPVNYFILPLFVESITAYSLVTSVQIGVMFTTISLVRKFAIRRWFESMRN